MIRIIPPVRPITPKIRSDKAGDGSFGSPRGSRTHKGIDYLAPPGSRYLAVCNGEITKHGLPYADSDYRYIEITDGDGFRHRMFYCKMMPGLLRRVVKKDDVIGISQDITTRYPGKGMKAHLHYEIKDLDGEYVNPEEFWNADPKGS